LEEDKEWLAQQPVKELKKCGYIKAEKPGAIMVRETLEFYGVVNTDKWKSRYINDFATAAYRKSEAHQATLGSMAAWLRMGEKEMQKMQLPEYNKDAFKSALEEIKIIVAKQPADFAKQLQQKCAKAGVAVIYTLCLPKAPVSGATRWFRSNPLIQLTDRHKTNDHFWFTFYHEAAHVLLHPKKEVFFEEFEGYQPDKQKEEEANNFAAKYLLPGSFEDGLPFKIMDEDVEAIAKKYKTHPGIVVGRLQHNGLVKYSFGNKHKAKVNLFNPIKIS
jgi:Zn-dependent peptidase ImmA (M78 family)